MCLYLHRWPFNGQGHSQGVWLLTLQQSLSAAYGDIHWPSWHCNVPGIWNVNNTWVIDGLGHFVYCPISPHNVIIYSVRVPIYFGGFVCVHGGKGVRNIQGRSQLWVRWWHTYINRDRRVHIGCRKKKNVHLKCLLRIGRIMFFNLHD